MKNQKGGFLSIFSGSAKQVQRSMEQADTDIQQNAIMIARPQAVSSLLSAGEKSARSRDEIYTRWAEMESNPFVGTALSLQVTAALGGHESTGEVVFVETKAGVTDKKMVRIAEEVASELAPMFNRICYGSCFTGFAFGDAYARVYSEKGKGVVDVCTDELVRPPLVQPYELGSKTMGYVVADSNSFSERLRIDQMARLKMPRSQWVPQHTVIEKSWRAALINDDLANHTLLPSMVGGSILFPAEEAFTDLMASLAGIKGQRWLDSIDEQLVTLNMTDMTEAQQKQFVESVTAMFSKSKEIAESAVKTGRPFLERVKHVLPVWSEKQVQTVGRLDGGASGRNSTITIEDAMLHARSLAGALGTDLSMIGFADQLSGGLGDGGFFRVSAHSAENGRKARTALIEFFNHIADIHCLAKYGFVLSESERPWQITFYSTVSALAKEQAQTRLDSANASLIILQAIAQLKDIGADEETAVAFLRDEMAVDEEKAKIYAAMVKQPEGGEAAAGGVF